MDTAQFKSLSDRGLVVTDSSGKDAVRVYLQYLPELPGASRDDRGKELKKQFEQVASKRAHTGVQLDPDSLSVSGQVIEALLPVERYEQATRELEDDNVCVDIVESFDATL
jgi:predicted nucleotidyltransferase